MAAEQALGSVSKSQGSIAFTYDKAFAHLATAKEHDAQRSPTAIWYYVEAAYNFLQASAQVAPLVLLILSPIAYRPCFCARTR